MSSVDHISAVATSRTKRRRPAPGKAPAELLTNAYEADGKPITGRAAAGGARGEAGKSAAAGSTHAAAAACVTRMGFAPGYKTDNQDACFAFTRYGGSGTALFGVFDGHGADGHHVSAFLAKHLPNLLFPRLAAADVVKLLPDSHPDGGSAAGSAAEPGKGRRWKAGARKALEEGFAEADRRLAGCGGDTSNSGSTGVVVLLHPGGVWTAWVGDSRAILVRMDANGRPTAVPLTSDHKPNRRDEHARIVAAGGRVAQSTTPRGQGVGPHRVWFANEGYPGLAMSRAFGDTVARRIGVTAVPEQRSTPLGASDRFLVLASDGVWDAMTNQEAAAIVTSGGDARQVCAALVSEAHRRWAAQREGYIDDITAVVVQLPEQAGCSQ